MQKVKDNYHSELPTRLRKLMEQKEITQEQLANYAQVSRQSISKYANGETCPNSDQLKAIAEYLNVSADYLLGNTNIKSADVTFKKICEITGLTEKALESIEKYSKNIPWRCDWLEPSEQPTSISVEINPILESSQFYEFAKLLSAFKYSLNYYKVNPCLERKRRVKLSRYDVSTMLESILIDIERKAGFKNGEFTRTSK